MNTEMSIVDAIHRERRHEVAKNTKREIMFHGTSWHLCGVLEGPLIRIAYHEVNAMAILSTLTLAFRIPPFHEIQDGIHEAIERPRA